MPNEDFEAVFGTFTSWGQFADLLSYDERTDTIALPDAP
jgi:hypothetical protein